MNPTSHHERGYRAVLLQESVKERLQAFRRGLPERDLAQERRLVTAGIELLLSRTELHDEWLRRVSDVVMRDLQMDATGD
jgi:hypothetical protein